MANYLSFQNIYESVMLAIGDAQYSRATETKAICNQIYLNEVCRCDPLYPLFWLLNIDDSQKTKTRSTITAITAASPPVVTSAAHGFVDGDVVTIYGVAGMTEVNYRTFVVDQVNANSFHLHDFTLTDIVGAGYTAYTSGGYAHHRGITLTDCNRIISANWHGYNKGLDFIGPEQLEGQASWMDSSISRPLKIHHKRTYNAAGDQADYLLWYQAPDAAYYLRLWYERLVDRLSAAGDVPIGPVEVGDAIIAGAISRLGENKVQVEAGVIWPQIYKMQLEAIRNVNRRWWEQHESNYDRSKLFLI